MCLHQAGMGQGHVLAQGGDRKGCMCLHEGEKGEDVLETPSQSVSLFKYSRLQATSKPIFAICYLCIVHKDNVP
jgi:hypothetical protein